jgi:Spy/CpxP family protein refolding chaperone
MHKHFLTTAAGAALVFGLAAGGARAHAQSAPSYNGHRGHAQMSPDRQLQRLSEALSLTDDQKNQIRPILEDRHQKVQSIRSDDTLSRQDRRSKMRSVFEESKSRSSSRCSSGGASGCRSTLGLRPNRNTRNGNTS